MFTEYIRDYDATHIFRFHLTCLVSHFLLGLLVLPSKELGPKLFSPLIHAFIRFLRKLGSANCLLSCREDINEFLDEAEFGRVGGEEGEEEEAGSEDGRNGSDIVPW
jgi:hypothetical protein